MQLTRAWPSIISALLLAGCTAMKPTAFENGSPQFRPDSFFLGKTHSSGVVENRVGRPTKRITTKTEGRMKNGILLIEQELMMEGSEPTHRSWQIRKIDAHHVDATANDIAGTAHGIHYGNAFQWSFILMPRPGNPLMNVRMSQSMYLEPDGKTLVIRSIIKKAGIVVIQLTEWFSKE